MIEAHGLCMRFDAVTAVDHATFTARPGEVLGLLGPNGAGKSTTMRILTTFLRPTEGRATVAGFDVEAQPLEVRRRIGYLPETPPLYLSMEVREALAFVGQARGLGGARLRERMGWVVERCGLERMFRTPCLHLSKGYRQRTGLAQALLHDPEVVILDEPTSGLDPGQVLEMRALVRSLAETRTVVLSTHILGEAAAVADRLVVMNRGRIVGAGTQAELRRQAEVHPHVRVVLRQAPPLAVGLISALEAAGDARRIPRDDEELTVLDVDELSPDLMEDIGAVAHEQRWEVLELARREGSLEEVFLALASPGVPHARAAEGGTAA